MKLELKWMFYLITAGCIAACGGDETTNDTTDPSESSDVSDASDASDGSDATDPADTTETRAQVILALTGDSGAGATLYSTNCQACHGSSGEGGTGTELRGLRFTEGLVNSVLDGKNYMPAFGTVLTDQEIADLIAHIESL